MGEARQGLTGDAFWIELHRVNCCTWIEDHARDARLTPEMRKAAMSCFKNTEDHHEDCKDIMDMIDDYLSSLETMSLIDKEMLSLVNIMARRNLHAHEIIRAREDSQETLDFIRENFPNYSHVWETER